MSLIQIFKTFNYWSGDAATMYQSGFQNPAIFLCSNQNKSNDEDQDKISSNLLYLLNNSSIEKTLLEYKVFLEIVTLLRQFSFRMTHYR
jgi:mannitol/fructose-specific phosphotransferase system IIA component (Ntr-type)